MDDWNLMTIDEHIEHLKKVFQFDSSGTAKSIYELIRAYDAKILSSTTAESVSCDCNERTKYRRMCDSHDMVLRTYKKREKSLQRRISAEHNVNKRLKMLLMQCEQQISSELLKDLVLHELKMLKYKYY